MSKPCSDALSQGGSCAGDCSWCHVTDPEVEYHCKSCNGYFDRLDWDEGKICAFCGSKNIELVSSIKSDSLQSTGQSGDGSGGGEEEADEVSPTRRPLGISPKIHGGKIEDLDPGLRDILKHRKQST